MGCIVALDLGTTGNRAIAFDENAHVVASHYEEFPQQFPQPGWVEHDPIAIWNSTKTVLNTVLAEVGAQNVTAIGITNQRETTVIWDKTSGQPIHNAIVWQCRRTAERCEDLRPHAISIKEKTGLFLDAYFSATKIEWLLHHVPDAREQAENGQLLFGTIDTWILWQLTNGECHATDVSNASRTMLFNIHTAKWDRQLLDLFDIPESLLPRVQATDAYFGDVQPQSGINVPALFHSCGD